MCLLLNQFGSVVESGSNVLFAYVIGLNHLSHRHAACKAADEAHNGNACAPNHGFAMLDFGIDLNTIVHTDLSTARSVLPDDTPSSRGRRQKMKRLALSATSSSGVG